MFFQSISFYTRQRSNPTPKTLDVFLHERGMNFPRVSSNNLSTIVTQFKFFPHSSLVQVKKFIGPFSFVKCQKGKKSESEQKKNSSPDDEKKNTRTKKQLTALFILINLLPQKKKRLRQLRPYNQSSGVSHSSILAPTPEASSPPFTK